MVSLIPTKFGEDGRKVVVNIDPDSVDHCVLIDYVVLHSQLVLILLLLE